MNQNNKKEQRLQRALERNIIPPYLRGEGPEILQGQRHNSGRPQRRSVAPSTLSTNEALRQPDGSSSAEHHAVQVVLQSEEFQTPCIWNWEKNYLNVGCSKVSLLAKCTQQFCWQNRRSSVSKSQKRKKHRHF